MAIREQKISQARRNLISRKARIWTWLRKEFLSDIKEPIKKWLEKLLKQAEHDIGAGEILIEPEMSQNITRIIEKLLKSSLAYGYWLQHVFTRECRSGKYRGHVKLADVPEDDELRQILEELIDFDLAEDWQWNNVVPETAIEWLKDYTPMLVGSFEFGILEKVRDVIRQSMEEGSTLQERIDALRESVFELQEIAEQRLEAIARTEITRADSMGSLIEMKTNSDVVGVEFSAILDDRTTQICESRHGLIMSINDPRLPEIIPPLHINCRSLLLSCTIYEYPDGVLTSHEFDEGLPETMQRDYDIQVIQDLLDSLE